MTLSSDDFAEFYSEMNDGRRPFRWQQRLVDHIIEHGRWPDKIAAPTGAGKSSVVYVHAFVNALRTDTFRPPRRLALVVNRRALVDNQAELAADLRTSLESPRKESVSAQVAAALNGMAVASADEPLGVVELRGALPPDRAWLDDPTQCQIICATPDMWGSRLLFRGYGSRRMAFPREAGMLAFDAVMVLDEAHLNRQLLQTARRVGELIDMIDAPIGVQRLQVVECTATPSGDDGSAVGVEPGDLEVDELLAMRLTRSKPVTVVRSPEARTGRASNAYASLLAQHALELHNEFGRAAGGRTIGCVVNRIDTATKVAEEIRKVADLRVRVLVGRMRPFDRKGLPAPLLTTEGDPDTDVLVATQTIEVGVDIDFSAMVTELAPGSALVQRSGRVNRLGRSTNTRIVVVSPEDDGLARDSSPYSGADLLEAQKWLEGRASDPEGMSPVAVQRHIAPPETPRRKILERLELADAELLSYTTEDLFVEPDLDLWLHDDLDDDKLTGGLVVRDLASLSEDDSVNVPIPPENVIAFVRATPPNDDEVFPCRVTELRTVIEQSLADNSKVYVQRAEEITEFQLGEKVKPGDVFIVDSEQIVCREGVVVDEPTQAASPVPFESFGIEVIRQQTVLAIYQGLSLLETQSMFEVGGGSGQVAPGSPDESGTPRWIIVLTDQQVERDESARQEWTASSAPVLLNEHAQRVEDRARSIAYEVGVSSRISDSLALGARHHDDGKSDRRFQRMLGATDGALLAKSRRRTKAAALAAKATSGLPTRWRHEQLSVVRCAEALRGHRDEQVVMRLVGTSHGYGRPWFPHSAETLEEDSTEVGRALFDDGWWQNVVVETERCWGAWGIAFLEMLLRSADGQVSSEGG